MFGSLLFSRFLFEPGVGGMSRCECEHECEDACEDECECEDAWCGCESE